MRRAKALILVLVLVTAAIWVAALLPGKPAFEVTFLDVGDGLCGVVRSPSGSTLVFDCGTASWRKSETVGEKLVAPYLQSLGVDYIDVAILTHPHADHVSGMAGLLRLKPAKLVLDLGARHASPYYQDFLEAVTECGARYRKAVRGQVIDLGGGVRADVLSPQTGAAYADLNDRSIVLRLTYGRAVFLLAADAGLETEARLIHGGCRLSAQVLQVGHHGSDTATSVEWLRAVRPEVAVISCSRRSRYGHPSGKTLRRLRSSGARVYTTANHGAISATTDGSTVEIVIRRKPR